MQVIKRPKTNETQTYQIEAYKTRDYSQFVFIDTNRPLKEGHVRSMKESLERSGWNPTAPLRAFEKEGKLFVIDGQHRLTAAKDLGIDVYYLLYGNEVDALREMISLNAYQSRWSINDFASHYAKSGNGNYKRILELVARFEINISIAAELVTGNAEGRRQLFRGGNFVFSEAEYARVEPILTHINEIRRLSDRYESFCDTNVFVRALYTVCSHPDYDHEIMMRQLKRSPPSLTPCRTHAQYLEVLSGIFNWKLADHNRVYFHQTHKSKRLGARADVPEAEA